MRAGYCDTVTSPEVERVVFRFQINGTSDPDLLVPGFQGVSDVTHVSAGVFDVTFETKYPTFIGALGTVMEATPTHDLLVKVSGPGAYSATTGILRVTIVGADGTPAAEDPVDNDWVFVEAFMGRRSGMHASKAI